MSWIIAAVIVALCVAVPIAIEFPVEFGITAAALISLGLLFKQGPWRASYVLVILTTLGAISSIEQWVAVANYGRVVGVAALLVATYTTTRHQESVPLLGLQKWILRLLALLAVIATASAVWSTSLVDTLIQSALLAALILIVYRLVTRRWCDRSTMVCDLRIGFVVISLLMAIGIVANYAGLLPATFTGRFQGLFNNPNMAALIAVIAVFIGWGLFLESRSSWVFLFLLPPLLTIALTESRTAFLAAAIGLVWTGVRAGPRMLLIITSVVAIVAVFGVALWQPVLSRFGVISSGDAFSGRTLGWETALNLLELRPIGYGWGATQSVFASAYQSGLSTFQPQSVHNSYLQLALEVGWAGFAVMALLLIGVIVLIFRQRPSGIEVGLSGAVVAGFVVQFSESALFGTGQPYPWLYWFAIAGLMASLRHTPRVPRVPLRARTQRSAITPEHSTGT